MEIFLTGQCKSLTGSLGRGFGYSIRPYKSKKGVRFFAKRDSKGVIPSNGHWRFILTCAGLALNKLHITDVKVSNRELSEALREANLPSPAYLNANSVKIYNARDILGFRYLIKYIIGL